jgi:hypothetical protein
VIFILRIDWTIPEIPRYVLQGTRQTESGRCLDLVMGGNSAGNKIYVAENTALSIYTRDPATGGLSDRQRYTKQTFNRIGLPPGENVR